MIVKNQRGEEFKLTEDEARFIRTLRRLDKIKQGRIKLYGNGTLSARLGGVSNYREFEGFSISCDGGDGGDAFD